MLSFQRKWEQHAWRRIIQPQSRVKFIRLYCFICNFRDAFELRQTNNGRKEIVIRKSLIFCVHSPPLSWSGSTSAYTLCIKKCVKINMPQDVKEKFKLWVSKLRFCDFIRGRMCEPNYPVPFLFLTWMSNHQLGQQKTCYF